MPALGEPAAARAHSVLGDQALIRWHCRWGSDTGDSVGGLNLMRVCEGLIVEAMGYIKGA